MTGRGGEAIRRTGALLEGGECRFVVWAPFRERVAAHLLSAAGAPVGEVPLRRDELGYWEGAARVPAGTRYAWLLDGATLRPDPCSFHQPEGVHASSEVVDPGAWRWSDAGWRGPVLSDLTLYELHVGTFTPEGTLEAIVPRLAALREVGLSAIELMPVAAFPGERGWGYDGVYPYAVHGAYGGPRALQKLVDACHGVGLAVVLDVVYNHLGPEGNYLRDFGPYFTPRYQTPWGEAVNLDGPHSDPVRHFFIGNALHWFERYHLDGLRLDAVHALYDFGARHFLAELSESVAELSRRDGRRRLLIAESDLNDVRVIRPRDAGGHGLDAQWNEDFHHALHALLTGERDSYYRDFGRIGQLETILRRSLWFGWTRSSFREKRFGSPDTAGCGVEQFVAYAQNHDQIGNRLRGDRLSVLVPPEALKLAAAAVVLSPFVPMLFMGEEYGETNPFAYFTSHGDPDLARAAREGRKREFAAFGWQEEPPDPQDPATFAVSRLDWERRGQGRHRFLLAFYRELFRLRRRIPALRHLSQAGLAVLGLEEERLLVLCRRHRRSRAAGLLHFGARELRWRVALPGGAGDGAAARVWRRVLDSAETRWDGPGSALPEELAPGGEVLLKPHQFALYRLFG